MSYKAAFFLLVVINIAYVRCMPGLMENEKYGSGGSNHYSNQGSSMKFDLTPKFSNMKRVEEKPVNEIASGLTSAVGKVAQGGSSIVDKVIQGGSSMVSHLAEEGSNVVSGAVQGAQGMISEGVGGMLGGDKPTFIEKVVKGAKDAVDSVAHMTSRATHSVAKGIKSVIHHVAANPILPIVRPEMVEQNHVHHDCI